jgi:tRNA (uracil-5-)-methyltransferase
VAAAATSEQAASSGDQCDQLQPSSDVLLLDPPRSGLDAPTLRLARRFSHILYISCCPGSLHQNLRGATCEQFAGEGNFRVAEGSGGGLLETHELVRMAAFDMFPATGHVEVGVYLRRRDSL